MMKFREMTTGRKAAIVIGNVAFWGGLLVGIFAPGVVNRVLLVGIEAVGLAIDVVACYGFRKKAV